MTRRRPWTRARLLACLVAIDLAASSPFLQAGQGPARTFRAAAEAVTVDVSVEQRGRAYRGLQVADFEVLDNAVPQVITSLSYERLPVDVTIAFDLSASVTGYVLEQLRRAMRQLRTDLRPGDRLKIVTFNNRVRRIVDLSDPAVAIDDAFARLRPSGSSAVLDTLAVTLAAPVVPNRRYLVVLFSDGHDTSSIHDASVLLDLARRTTPTIFVVLPAGTIRQEGVGLMALPGVPDGPYRQIYHAIARATGGTTFTVGPDQNLSQTFSAALAQFRSSYVLHFTPTGVDPGGVHELTVRVKRDGVDVRARREYVRQ